VIFCSYAFQKQHSAIVSAFQDVRDSYADVVIYNYLEYFLCRNIEAIGLLEGLFWSAIPLGDQSFPHSGFDLDNSIQHTLPLTQLTQLLEQ
jgi:hypothetical protein